MYSGLTEEILDQAWRYLYLTVKQMAENGVTNRLGGALVVVIGTDPVYTKLHDAGTELNADVATSKARISSQNGMPSGRVQWEFPHILRLGDTKWEGGYAETIGFGIGYSGVQGVYDEMFSRMHYALVQGICRAQVHLPGGLRQENTPWVGGDEEYEEYIKRKDMWHRVTGWPMRP